MEFCQLCVLLHDKDIEDVDSALLIDRVCFQSVDVVDVVEGEVALAHSVKILIGVVIGIVLDLDVACHTPTSVARRT